MATKTETMAQAAEQTQVVTLPQDLLKKRQDRIAGGNRDSLQNGDQVTISKASRVTLEKNTRAREGQPDTYYAVSIGILRGGRTLTSPLSVNTVDAQIFRVADATPIEVNGEWRLPLQAQSPRFKSLYLQGELKNDASGQGWLEFDQEKVISLRGVDCWATEFGTFDKETLSVRVRKGLDGKPVSRTIACEA